MIFIQPFDFPFFEELSDPVLEQIAPNPKVYPAYELDGFATMQYSGSGDVTAPIQPADVVIPPGIEPNTSDCGCEPEDFTGFMPGNIALIQRGSCSFLQKAMNAQNAGASGVIIFNEGQDGRTNAFLGTLQEPALTVPVVGAAYGVGEELYNLYAQGEDVSVRMAVDAVSEVRTTHNIIGETLGGRDDRVVVVGAHLDSVSAGPGIDDNGSGVAGILEIALQMAELGITPYNKVRFAFWGAEEEGLTGSRFYVDNLSARGVIE